MRRMRAGLLGAAALLVSIPLLASPAHAADKVTVDAKIDGKAFSKASESSPATLDPKGQAVIEVAIRNDGGSPVEVRTVRLEGRVMGLTFLAFDTTVPVTVAPGATETRTFSLDLGGLGGQANGLVPGTIKILDAERHTLATEGGVLDVRGSLKSVYGTFGIVVALFTAVSFVACLVAMARHRLPRNRLKRALRFLTPGIGLGLTLVYFLSAIRFFVPLASRWVPLMLVSALILVGIGFLTPDPGDEPEHPAPEDELAMASAHPDVHPDAPTEALPMASPPAPVAGYPAAPPPTPAPPPATAPSELIAPAPAQQAWTPQPFAPPSGPEVVPERATERMGAVAPPAPAESTVAVAPDPTPPSGQGATPAPPGPPTMAPPAPTLVSAPPPPADDTLAPSPTMKVAKLTDDTAADPDAAPPTA